MDSGSIQNDQLGGGGGYDNNAGRVKRSPRNLWKWIHYKEPEGLSKGSYIHTKWEVTKRHERRRRLEYTSLRRACTSRDHVLVFLTAVCELATHHDMTAVAGSMNYTEYLKVQAVGNLYVRLSISTLQSFGLWVSNSLYST